MPSKATFRAVARPSMTNEGVLFRPISTLPREFGAGEEVLLREVTADELRSERQLKYWFGAVVKAIQACWLEERGKRYSKEEVHAALMTAFGGGLVQTPLGPSYPTSKLKTKRAFAEITDEARSYAWETYDCRIPTPDEWNGEDAA
jgi:hypothetical protein